MTGPTALAAALLSSGLLAGQTAPAVPMSAAPSFGGSCQFSGTVTFAPPLTITPGPGTGAARATGQCTGTLVDANGNSHHLDAAPAGYQASDAAADMDCVGGVATGAGTLTVSHQRLRFTLTETRAGAVSALQLQSGTWSASGVASASLQADPVQIAAQCAGSGITSAPIDITLNATAS